LIAGLDARLPEGETGFRVATPREDARRGGHVALRHPRIAAAVNAAAKARGLIPDFRPPDLIRLCPAPLYISAAEVDEAVERLRSIWETRAFEEYPGSREVVA
jgi:kynureninase